MNQQGVIGKEPGVDPGACADRGAELMADHDTNPSCDDFEATRRNVRDTLDRLGPTGRGIGQGHPGPITLDPIDKPEQRDPTIEPQGEVVDYSLDGSSHFTPSEKTASHQTLKRVDRH